LFVFIGQAILLFSSRFGVPFKHVAQKEKEEGGLYFICMYVEAQDSADFK